MPAKPRRIANAFAAFVRHFGTEDVGEVVRGLEQEGWWEKTRHAVMRHVAKRGTPADLDVLVARGVNLREDVRPLLGTTVLHVAAAEGRLKMVAHLLEHHRVDPNVLAEPFDPARFVTSALCQATSKGRERVVAFLLTHGADPDGSEHGAPVLKAIENQSTPMLRQLLAAGASVNGERWAKRGYTPLHAAVRRGWEKGVVVLDAAGASWDARDSQGKTPLDVAASACPVLAGAWAARLAARTLESTLPTTPSKPRSNPRF